MKVLMILIGIAIVAVAVILLLAARKPDMFSLQRSVMVDAPAERIYPLIDDLRAHEAWSPFDKPNPDTRKRYTGSPSGIGAVYEWEGAAQAGSGRLQIRQSEPPSRAVMQLDMLKPFKASNEVVFTLEPAASGTRVTWSMRGETPFLAKVMHVFVNMDRMVGKDFETGLANLKSIAEREPLP